MADLIFVTGGARSGKSRFAQAQAEKHPGQLLYVATALGSDEEMVARITRHQAERGPRWVTLEEPLDWVTLLPNQAQENAAILVDCVTIWISNLLVIEGLDENLILERTDAAIVAMQSLACPVYVVSNEVGQGVVPVSPLGRTFRDIAGRVNQRMSSASNDAWMLVAGLPLRLK
jgi:adenosylcobinamide kinase/adenosylcobinamide-phosphate guanylyltransferase